ncbi:MAG: tetratricopeptide repeat protein [Actinomycetes bacterium]
MGWVYLAQDRKLHDRWVVLKGLLDSGDEPAMAAAIAERRFLSQVSHTNIVEIYNFVEHADAGYIVMEYVGGSSLREIRLARRADVGQPLPVSVVLAYGLEVLTALGFLHSRGLLYCDLKPDNVIHSGDLVKLIDLGGVRRIDDDTGDVFGTVGYQAPEISSVGPSVSSDLFTVGRLMAVLAVDFPGYQDEKRYATTLPPDGEAFARHPSFHHLLLRATDPDPGRRFRSAADMADQAFGVLRQVVAGEGGQVVPAASRRFGAERVPDADHATWRSLPLPLPDSDDDAAGVLATLAGATPEQVLEALEAVAPTREVRLRQVRAALESDDVTQARAHLAAAVDMSRQTPVPDGYGGDWRVQWWTAAVALATGGTEEAASALHAVSTWLPGELSPHLALGVLAETQAGFAERSSADDEAGRHWQEAAAHYGLVSRTDPATSGASFASARALLKLGDRTGAIAALDRVPPTAVAFGVAQIRICRALVAPVAGAPPAARELVRASEALAELDARDVSPTTQLALRREVLAAGLALTLAEPDGVDGIRLGGTPCREQDLRLELERTIRLLASHVSGDAERAALVDEANSWRPWTLT